MNGSDKIYVGTRIGKWGEPEPGKESADFLISNWIDSAKTTAKLNAISRTAWQQALSENGTFPPLGSLQCPVRLVYSGEWERSPSFADVHACKSECYLQVHSAAIGLSLADLQEMLALANDVVTHQVTAS